MGLPPNQKDESGCHPERSEGSAFALQFRDYEQLQILRCAQNDRLSRERSEGSPQFEVTSKIKELQRSFVAFGSSG
jgi:hypothetical protein